EHVEQDQLDDGARAEIDQMNGEEPPPRRVHLRRGNEKRGDDDPGQDGVVEPEQLGDGDRAADLSLEVLPPVEEGREERQSRRRGEERPGWEHGRYRTVLVR